MRRRHLSREMIGMAHRITSDRLALNATPPAGYEQQYVVTEVEQQVIDYHAQAEFGYGGRLRVGRAEMMGMTALAIRKAP